MSTWSRLVYEETTIGIPGVHSIGQYNYVAAREGLPPHNHEGCVEISLLVKGYQAYQVRGRTYHVKGGEQYISLPGEMHDTGSEPQDKGIMYWLILDVAKEPDKFLFMAPGMAHKLIGDLLQFPTRHFPGHAQGHATLDLAFQALRRIKSADECTGIFLKNGPETVGPTKSKKTRRPANDVSFNLIEAANHIVYYILQTIASSRASVKPISRVIQESLDFMVQNEEVWLSVAQVAEKVKLSESYFKILFRDQMGLPPAEYMLRRKIDAAKVLLNQPGCNITELAYRLGFSSSQYFATVFKRFTNQTPTEFMAGQSMEFVNIVEQPN
jgi:AraC-like DNA-binding protein